MPSSRRRSGLLAIVAVLVVVAVVVGGLVVLRGRGGGSSAGGRYSGPNDDAIVLYSYDSDQFVADASLATFGSDERPTQLADGYFSSAGVLDELSSLVAAGGPIIGVTSDDDVNAVVAAEPGSEEVTELVHGGDLYQVFYDPDRDNVLVIEDRSGGERCYVGKVDGQLQRLGRGDICGFSADGAYVLAYETDDNGEVDYEVTGLDGDTVLSGHSVSSPVFANSSDVIVTFDGSSDRTTAMLTDVESGDTLAESSRGHDVRLLATNDRGQALIASSDDEGTALLELLSRDGSVTEIVSNAGPVAADFLTDAGSEVLVVTTGEDGAELSIAREGSDGAEVELTSIAAADDVVVRAPADGIRAGRYVALGVDSDGTGGVLFVATDAGVSEVDLDENPSLRDTYISSDASHLFATVESYDGDSSSAGIVAVDLHTGESTWVVEDWSSVRIDDVKRDGSGVAVVGRENADDTDVSATHIDLGGTSELIEEAAEIDGVRYTADEASIVFTISDGDVDTYRYELGSRAQPELLYAGQAIAYAGWDSAGQASWLSDIAQFEVSLPTPGCDESFPGLEALSVGDSVSGFVDVYGSAQFCLGLDEGATVSALVTGDFDSMIEISGPSGPDGVSGNTFSNDDYDGSNAGVVEFLEAGAYLVTVTGYETASGTFTLTAG